MSPAAKRPVPKSSKGSRSKTPSAAGAALGVAASKAADLLADPQVRQQLLEFGGSLTDSVRARAEARRAASPQGPGEAGNGPRSHALRQRRLEKRADKLSENLELLRQATGEESAAALGSMADVVGRLRLALAVANNLPLRRRVGAQGEIATALDTLEQAVLSATMPEDAALPGNTDRLAEGGGQRD